MSYPNPFVWSTAYATNVQKMDDQHKGLFDGINKACAGGQGDFDALAGLVTAHFAAEEADHGLGGDHKATHAAFLADVGAKWGAGKGTFEPFAKQWLHDHIKGSDMPQYGK